MHQATLDPLAARRPDGNLLMWSEQPTGAHIVPGGASGKTLTIERSELKLTPGAQSTSAELRLRVRASQGQRHRIGLPEPAELESPADG